MSYSIDLLETSTADNELVVSEMKNIGVMDFVSEIKRVEI